MLVVFINYCLGFQCCRLVVVTIVWLVPAKWLARKASFFTPHGKIISEMTYNMSSGALNPTISIYLYCPWPSELWPHGCLEKGHYSR